MKQLKHLSATFLAVAMIAIAGCASTSQQSSTGEYLDDTVITTKAKAAIVDDPELKAAEINVETYKGVVQLSGFVSSQEDINHAIEVVKKIDGVKSVKNDMRLK